MRIIISLHIQPKIMRKSHVSTIFQRKIDFCYFSCIFWMHPNFWGSADFMMSQWRHVRFNGTHFGINAPFQITVLVRFSSVWFSLVTVLLIVCPRSLLLCPFHKKLRIWWKKSFGFCQTDNPRSSFMMYCYSTDLNVYTWVELTYQIRQVFWIQFLT